MKIDDSVPGRSTVADWDPEPVLPFTLEHGEQWRDAGRYGSYMLTIGDAAGQQYHFFFDKMLSRLCHGSGLEKGDDAAFIVPGSRLERMLVAFLETQRDHPEFGDYLDRRLDLAAAYLGCRRDGDGAGARGDDAG